MCASMRLHFASMQVSVPIPLIPEHTCTLFQLSQQFPAQGKLETQSDETGRPCGNKMSLI